MAVSKTTDTTAFIADETDFDVNARPSAASTPSESSGWDSASKLYTAPKLKYATEIKLTERPQLISFLGDGPFHSYGFHFLKQKTEGRRGYICNGRNCPLCTILKDTPSKKTAFSIVVFNEETGEPEKQMLVSGSRLFNTLLQANTGKGPLENNFWEISKTGTKMQDTAYTVTRIKDRDLQEEYGVDPDSARELMKKLEPFTVQDLNPLSDQELIDIIKEL